MNIILRRDGVRLVDFNAVFKKHIETTLLTELDGYKLVKNGAINLRNKDVKRLMYHYIIHGLCDYVLSVKGKEKIVITYCDTAVTGTQLRQFVPEYELLEFLNKFIIKIRKMLPVKFLIVQTPFNVIRKDIKDTNGESKDIINNAKSIAYGSDISGYTFSKARYFAKKYGLDFLSNNYFQQVKNKQLILV